MSVIPEKTVERLIVYRRLLIQYYHDASASVFSHQLAAMAGMTPAQVRRDLMAIGYLGSPAHGYATEELVKSIGKLIDPPEKEEVALVGVGQIGRAILGYLNGRNPHIEITAAFDTDPEKTGRVIQGCRCHPVGEIARIVRERRIRTGILTVPGNAAQAAAEALVGAGVRGILNYAPTRLRLAPDVFVENRDMMTSVEKVAYYSRRTLSKETPA